MGLLELRLADPAWAVWEDPLVRAKERLAGQEERDLRGPSRARVDLQPELRAESVVLRRLEAV